MTQKDRRGSGWVYPEPLVPQKLIIENDLFIEPYYDSWIERRDGCRGYPDKTKFRPETYWFKHYWQVDRWNKKLKRMLKVRFAKKHGRAVFYIYGRMVKSGKAPRCRRGTPSSNLGSAFKILGDENDG